MNRRIIKWCFEDVYSSLKEDWIEAAVKQNDFDPRLGHYGSLQRMIDAKALPAIMSIDGKNQPVGEVMDFLNGLKAGTKYDVVRVNKYQGRRNGTS